MCVAWRHRLAIPVFAILVLIVCDGHTENEAQIEKLVYPRGNHWAVGHLMGKKSIEDLLGSEERDVGGERYLTAAEAEEHTQPSGFLQALINAVVGPESKRERKRDTRLRQQRALEQRKLLKEQTEREREKATKLFATGFKPGRCQHKLKMLIYQRLFVVCST